MKKPHISQEQVWSDPNKTEIESLREKLDRAEESLNSLHAQIVILNLQHKKLNKRILETLADRDLETGKLTILIQALEDIADTQLGHIMVAISEALYRVKK